MLEQTSAALVAAQAHVKETHAAAAASSASAMNALQQEVDRLKVRAGCQGGWWGA
jgi:hypothetical protein